MTAIARRYEISARRALRVERNLCLYVIIIIFELAGIYTDLQGRSLQVWLFSKNKSTKI